MTKPKGFRIYDRHSSAVFRSTRGLHGGLSNMAPGFSLFINGITIRTSEALYQACRFPDHPPIQSMIIAANSPMTAKMKSRRYSGETRSDWESVRIPIMRWCLEVKLCQNWTRFSRVLSATGKAPIVEESPKDDFWAAKPTSVRELTGRNALGRLLMELRQKAEEGGRSAFSRVTPPDIPNFLLAGSPIDDAVMPEHESSGVAVVKWLPGRSEQDSLFSSP